MVAVKQASDQSIAEAAALLKSGHLVALPRKQIIGLGANALDGVAVAKIFAAKGRPSFNPLIVHVPDLEAASALVEMSDAARAVAAKFWPGPLTIILPRKSECPVSDLCSGRFADVAIRIPSHPVALKLLRAAGVPVAAPSANKSGSISPTTPQHVLESLGDAVDFILAAGASSVGLESTVLDLSGDKPLILRPGAITAEDLEPILGPVAYDLGDHGNDVKSPGQLLKHYAPSIPVRLNAVDVEDGEALLAFGSLKFMGLKSGGFAKDMPADRMKNLSDTGDLYEAAANLFRMMRDLDKPGNQRIAVMNIPEHGIGIAINDRLKRAAGWCPRKIILS